MAPYIAILSFVLLAATNLASAAQSTSPFLGLWVGEINDSPEKDTQRLMNIVEVNADALVRGSWGVQTPGSIGNAEISIDGNTIKVVTSARSTVVLQLDGAQLKGTFTTAKGASYPIVLERKSWMPAPSKLSAKPSNWCDCMRFKRSDFQTAPWSSARTSRCTDFSSSSQTECTAQGSGPVIDFDVRYKQRAQ